MVRKLVEVDHVAFLFNIGNRASDVIAPYIRFKKIPQMFNPSLGGADASPDAGRNFGKLHISESAKSDNCDPKPTRLRRRSILDRLLHWPWNGARPIRVQNIDDKHQMG
jgi:hypothetical protein